VVGAGALAVTLLQAQEAQEVAVLEARLWGEQVLLELLILAAVAVARVVLVEMEALAAPASSLSATSAHSSAQVARSHRLAATPSTPSHRPALTPHKEKTWHILQKSTTASWNK
jgi:hypothetical protein